MIKHDLLKLLIVVQSCQTFGLLSLRPLILCLLDGGLLTLALLFNYFEKISDGYQMMELVSFLRSARCMYP
jgi:hypothetical protein